MVPESVQYGGPNVTSVASVRSYVRAQQRSGGSSEDEWWIPTAPRAERPSARRPSGSETMKALVLEQSGFAEHPPSSMHIESLDGLLRYDTIPIPVLGDGQVLIRVKMSPVNPSDVAFVLGAYGQPRVSGVPGGFEGVGEVVASGGGVVADRMVGRRVSFYAGISGAWAEYAVAEARACIPLRSEVRDQDGAALLVNPFSAWAFYSMARQGDSKAFVMTAAASQLCKLLAVLAAANGLRPISLVRRDEHIGRLSKLGAVCVLNTEGSDFAGAMNEVLDRGKPLLLLDAMSGPVPVEVFRAMPPSSRRVVYGGLDPRPTDLPDPAQFIFEGKRVDGFWLTSWLAQGSLVRAGRAAMAVQKMFIDGTWTTEVAASCRGTTPRRHEERFGEPQHRFGQPGSNGLTTRAPVGRMSATLRVARARSCSRAVAANRPSTTGTRFGTESNAHRSLMATVTGRIRST
jgi:NADPH:quinone reductase-like Zn-dependent oxidoreductase